MKKIIIIAATILGFALYTSANAKSNSKDGMDDSVSAYVHNNASKIVWTTSSIYNVANFSKDGYKMKAFFDESGSLVSTTRMLKNRNELPKAALDKIEKDYSNWGMTDLFEEKGLDRDLVYYARITDGVDFRILKITPNGRIQRINIQ